VRLKAEVVVMLLRLKRISIPFGAIKSVDNVKYRKMFAEFQFLLVRLKAVDIGKKLS